MIRSVNYQYPGYRGFLKDCKKRFLRNLFNTTPNHKDFVPIPFYRVWNYDMLKGKIWKFDAEVFVQDMTSYIHFLGLPFINISVVGEHFIAYLGDPWSQRAQSLWNKDFVTIFNRCYNHSANLFRRRLQMKKRRQNYEVSFGFRAVVGWKERFERICEEEGYDCMFEGDMIRADIKDQSRWSEEFRQAYNDLFAWQKEEFRRDLRKRRFCRVRVNQDLVDGWEKVYADICKSEGFVCKIEENVVFAKKA